MDINSYSLTHSLVSENYEQQYLQVMSSDVIENQSHETSNINRENADFLITSPTISDQQLLYLQDTHMFLPISVSLCIFLSHFLFVSFLIIIKGIHDQDSSEEIQTFQLEGNSESDNVIDLNELLQQYNTTDLQTKYYYIFFNNLKSNILSTTIILSHQYAVLKEGKFHLQLMDLTSPDDLSGLLNIDNASDIIISNSDEAPVQSNKGNLKLTDIKGNQVVYHLIY